MRAFSTNSRRLKSLRIPGLIVTVLGAGALLTGTALSQSVTPQSVDPWQHFVDCAGVLISAPDIHAQNCLPSNIPPEGSSLVQSKDGETDCYAPAQYEDGYSDCYEDDFPDDIDDDDNTAGT